MGVETTTPKEGTQQPVATASDNVVTLSVTQFGTIEQTMVELANTMKSIGSAVKTQSERMEAVEKQLADAERINEEKAERLAGAMPIFAKTESVDDDIIFKEITETTPVPVAKAILEKAIGSPTKSGFIHELHEWSDTLKLMCGYLRKQPHELNCYGKYTDWVEKTGLGKVMSVVGSPANWIPEGWSGELLTFYQQRLRVASLFEQFEMPNDPFRWDFLGTGITVYIRDEPVTDPASRIRASDHSQDVITFSTKELAARIVLSRKLTEDALAGYIPRLRSNLIPRAMAEAKEDALINGDVSATHFDTVVVAGDDVRKAWPGLRFIANRESATFDVQASSTAYAYSDFSQVLLQNGEFGIEVDEGAWIMSNAAYVQALDFDEVKTLDKINLPTNVNGVVNIILGRPVIVSGKYPQTLDSSGLNPLTPDVLSGFVHVNHPQFMIGFRREDEIEQDRDIQTGQEIMVITTRRDFKQMLPTGNLTVAAGVNVPT